MNFGLKALACLLLYPDAALKDNLPEIRRASADRAFPTIRKTNYIFLLTTWQRLPYPIWAKRLCLDI